MADRLKRALRVDHIKDLFLAGWAGTTRDLAERYGVSQRTIQRDLADLQGEPFRLPLVVEATWRCVRDAGNNRRTVARNDAF